MPARLKIGAVLLIACFGFGNALPASAAQDANQVGNWFNDPFFQVRSAVGECPEPLGPRTTRAEAIRQEHYRAERGTSCYLSGECKKPNAYFYDADIAQGISQVFQTDATLARESTLWITVTRRFVYVEGCKAATTDLSSIEAKLRSIPDVQLVIVNVATDPHGHLPYTALRSNSH